VKPIKLIQQGTIYLAYWKNGVPVGEILMGDDGYYDWWPCFDRGGCLTEGFLLAMYNTLHELNKAWDEQIQNDPRIGHREHDLE
jgi:hypothetical protein